MYTGLKHLHSTIPYLLIPILLIAVIVFFAKKGGKNFTSNDKRLALISLILAHIQFLVGLVLYFISPIIKAAFASGEILTEKTSRFYAVEHIVAMLLAIVLITVGYSKSKRLDTDSAKFKTLSRFYLIALILILSRVPWDVWPSFL